MLSSNGTVLIATEILQSDAIVYHAKVLSDCAVVGSVDNILVRPHAVIFLLNNI